MATWKTVQKIATKLPETEEGTSYGTPAFKVKGKLFARMRNEPDGGMVLWTEEKEALLAAEPGKFFTTPHYDGHPTVLVRLGAVTDTELRELVTDSWRMRAPAKVLKAHPEI